MGKSTNTRTVPGRDQGPHNRDGGAWYDDDLTQEELEALKGYDINDLDDFSDDELIASELGFDDGIFGVDKIRKPQRHSSTDPTKTSNVGGGQESWEGNNPEPEIDPAPQMDDLISGDNVAGYNAFQESEFTYIEDGAAAHIPVPRITIYAFCETAATTRLLEGAAIDRRLSKTHLVVHMGGIEKAIDYFQTGATPNLIILETLDGGPTLINKLSALAEVCDASTKVIIIGAVNDISLYRELIRQGISDYVVNPRSPLQLIKAISNLYADPAAGPIGKTIAFVGARGGVGSSTIAHNVGWCTAEELESDTVIVDFDLPFGTVSLDFEHDPTSGLLEALASPQRLDDVLLDRLLQKHTDRLSLFTAPNLLDRDYDLDDNAFELVVDVVRNSAPTIIIDMPHLWSIWSRRLLQTADEIVITTTPDLAAFRNTKNIVDAITSARPNDTKPYLIVNQYDPRTSTVQPEQYAEHVGIDPICTINWEPQLFHTAATNATPLTEVSPRSKAVQSLTLLSQMLLGRATIGRKRKSFDVMQFFKK